MNRELIAAYLNGEVKTLTNSEQKELARIALASLTAEPALYAAEETLAYANMGELHLTCLSEPMGDAVIPLYIAPPASVSVPDALPENDDEEGNDIDYMEPSEVYALGRAAGWNALRAAMLQGKAGALPSFDDWRELAGIMYQAAGVYDMPVRVMDLLSAAQSGRPFTHLLNSILPIEEPKQEAE